MRDYDLNALLDLIDKNKDNDLVLNLAAKSAMSNKKDDSGINSKLRSIIQQNMINNATKDNLLPQNHYLDLEMLSKFKSTLPSFLNQYQNSMNKTWNDTHINNMDGNWNRLPLSLDALFSKAPRKF